MNQLKPIQQVDNHAKPVNCQKYEKTTGGPSFIHQVRPIQQVDNMHPSNITNTHVDKTININFSEYLTPPIPLLTIL